MTEILLCQANAGKLQTKKINIPSSSPVSKLVKEAESFSKAPANLLVLTYQGTTIRPGTDLDSYQISQGGLVMVAVLPSPPSQKNKSEPVKMNTENIKRFAVAFKTAFKNPSFSTVVKRLLERENMDNLAAACPGLSEDVVAQGFLTRPELLLHLLDQETLTKVAESHPSLLEAANNLSAAVHEEQQSAGRTAEETGASGPSGSGGSYFLDELSDEEMDAEDGSRGPQRSRSFNAITPAQLAQALAAAAAGGGQGGLIPFQGVTGMAPQIGGTGPSQSGPGATAPQSSASTPGAGRITTDMFQQAIQQALLGMGSPSQSQPVGSPTSTAALNTDADSGDLASKVNTMKEMGIVDEGLALQALQIMGGDLQAAVDLIFSGWEGGDDSMQ